MLHVKVFIFHRWSTMVPADCSNCTELTVPQSPSTPSHGSGESGQSSVNWGVVTGVVGGMALVGIVVFVVVPLVRSRGRRRGRQGSPDVESACMASRRSSFCHQKMPSGPDALQPLLAPVSSPGLRGGKTSEDSVCGDGRAWSSAGATISHGGQSAGGGGVGTAVDGHVEGAARASLPSPQLSPNSPGVRPRADISPHNSSSSSTPPLAPALDIDIFSPVPRPTMDLARSGSRARGPAAQGHRRGMEPVLEDSASRYARSLQLPSPPASPEHGPQPEWRANISTPRRRPAPTSAPATTLPFRPRSSTVTSTPLASAFQTSVLAGGRHPSVAAVQQSARARPSSASMEPTSYSHAQSVRPADAARRTSTADIITPRHRVSYAPSEAGSSPQTEARAAPSDLHRTRYSQRERDSDSVSVQTLPSYSDARGREHGYGHGRAPSFATPAHLNPNPPPHLRPPHSHSRSVLDVPRSGPSTVVWKPQPSGSQPALVRRKDSNALRPIPSSFIHSPPLSPLGPGPAAGRSRSNSVRTARVIPPLDALPSLEFEFDRFSIQDGERSRRNSAEQPVS